MNAAHPVIGLRRVMLSPAFQHGWPGENLLPMTLSAPFSGRRISVLANATRLFCLSITAMVFLAGVSLPADAGEAAIDCVRLAPWTNYPTPRRYINSMSFVVNGSRIHREVSTLGLEGSIPSPSTGSRSPK